MNDNELNTQENVVPFRQKEPEPPKVKMMTLQEYGEETNARINILEIIVAAQNVINEGHGELIKDLDRKVTILWFITSILFGGLCYAILKMFL